MPIICLGQNLTLMNQLEESNGKLSEFIPDTSNPSKEPKGDNK